MPGQSWEELFAIVDRLIGPTGCPWDREQTPESLAEYILEESHELVSAIRSGNEIDICEEMGDVIFLLFFISRLYEKQGEFNFRDVLNRNREKMIRRHPHIFGDRIFNDMNEQLATWEKIKRAEHAGPDGKERGIFTDLPDTLPPLTKAYRIHSKAAKVGFTWEENDAVEQQVEVEWLEWIDAVNQGDANASKHEFGDFLFSLVELGRRRGIKANEALDFAIRRFLRRFARMEELAEGQGKIFPELSLEEKDALWATAKAEESSTTGR